MENKTAPMQLEQNRKKLIEAALPLESINEAGAREKSIRHGHPSTLHLWWSRKPLAVARAVIFAQMVDDPSEYVDVLLSDPSKKRAALAEMRRRKATSLETTNVSDEIASSDQQMLEEIIAELERERLFDLIKELVKWENTNNARLLKQANAEIWQSWRRTCAQNVDHPRAAELFDRYKLPAFHDPFAGGGALPLEAQRLGLEAYASDLNPVAVLINKAMIEIPPMYADQPPVNPESQNKVTVFPRTWSGAQGLAEDVRYYGEWMRDEAHERIGHLYPKVEIKSEMALERPDLKPYIGQKLTVIAWLWARTVKSPNPAFRDVDVPLAYTFMLSTRKGKEAYVEPVINGKKYHFTVKVGVPPEGSAAKQGTKSGKSGSSFKCLISGIPMPFDYLRGEAKAGRMGVRLMAIVVEGKRKRVYLSPCNSQELVADQAKPNWTPDFYLPEKALGFRVQEYGMIQWSELFTSRQLVALTTFSDLVKEAMVRIRFEAIAAGLTDDNLPLREDGKGATAYAQAVGLYLAFVLSKQADLTNSLCRWEPNAQCPRNLFGRQAIPMIWSYAEGNPLGNSSGSWKVFIDGIIRAFYKTFKLVQPSAFGKASQLDAKNQDQSLNRIVSTDPPYYDNIGYADLSDFFYIWLRMSLASAFPELFNTLAVPKTDELVATPYRHGNTKEAEIFFLQGMTQAMSKLSHDTHPAYPVTVYYAFKQSESKNDSETTSTGWETFLDALINAGFAISGTWPMRTENATRLVGIGTNALASSIVLVCRPRQEEANAGTLREFLMTLRSKLPNAIRLLQMGNVAPVDLAQAAIGPGMEVYSRYAKVLDVEGRKVSVRDALALINQVLDEIMSEQEGDYDEDSRWALSWFQQHGFSEGDYGIAETLSKAKNTSVGGMVEAGILTSQKGQVCLLKPNELSHDWNPETDTRLTVWEVVHHLIRVLSIDGEEKAGQLAARIDSGTLAKARELCYKLFIDCDRRKRAEEALAYNSLVQSWPEIIRISGPENIHSVVQGEIF